MIAWFISFFFALPLLGLLFFLVTLRLLIKNKKKAFFMAIDLSTFFFIISVHFHLSVIFEQSFLIFIIVGLIMAIMIVYYLEYRRLNKPSFIRASKRVWRLSFLFSFASYFILTVFGIIDGIVKNT